MRRLHFPFAARRLRRAASPLLLLAALTLAAACSPIKNTHGYTPRSSELDSLQVGVDTRASVQNKLGRPSTLGAFDDQEWLYISIKSETLAFFEPEVTEQRVVLVVFDADGRVADVGDYGMEDGRVIDLVTRTTPTSGRKLTILQQAFQNIGRFGGSSAIQRRGGGVGLPGG
ncbi:MAG: outer membrane protein assembly factor BamE [Pseudomonadota bacterium]